MYQKLVLADIYLAGLNIFHLDEIFHLAEINVDRQNEILKRGYEMGQSRVICGYHFQSDVDAARLVSSAVVARLHANDSFMGQLKKAKDEFATLQKAGKVKPSDKK